MTTKKKADPYAGEWYDVKATIERGPGAKPERMIGMGCNLCPLRLADAEKLAAEERAKSYISDVRIVRRKSYRDA